LTAVDGRAELDHAKVIASSQLGQVGLRGHVGGACRASNVGQSAVDVELVQHGVGSGVADAGSVVVQLTAQVLVQGGVAESSAQSTCVVVDVQSGAGSFVDATAVGGVGGANEFGVLTTSGGTHVDGNRPCASQFGGDVTDAVGTGAACNAVAPQVGDRTAGHAFRGVGEAAQGADFIQGGVLVAHAHGTEAAFEGDIGLAVGALAVTTG